MIKEVTIVTAQGVKAHTLGEFFNVGIITDIKISQLWFQGDPYDHYCGYDLNGTMLFSINCLVPCEVVYCT